MDPQFQDFPAPQAPQMGSGYSVDPMTTVMQNQQYMMQNNAIAQQQQQMMDNAMNSMPTNWVASQQYNMPSQTFALAQQGFMGGVSNFVQGGMAAASQLGQQFSRVHQMGQRIVAPSQYNDLYMGPNNFALESSMRRELASKAGFTHETTAGRLMLGGYRPDFMTEHEFAKQMDASWDARVTGARVSAGFAAAEGVIGVSSGFTASLIAAPVLGAIKRGVLSTEHFREQQAVTNAWQEDAMKRYGFGAGGQFDRVTSAEVAKGIEHHDVPSWESKFLRKSLSKKLGLRPEVEYGDIKKQMEELGMFATRSGDFDKDKVMSGVKNIADDMKWLAGIARTMKEEIPKIAAEIQKGTGLSYNDKRLQGLTRQVAQTSSVTGIEAGQLAGIMSQSGQLAKSTGFDATSFGTDIMKAIQSTVSLQSMGLVDQTMNAPNYAQTLQATYAQNVRNGDPFTMSQNQPGKNAKERMDNFTKEVSNDPNKWIYQLYGTQSGEDASKKLLGAVRDRVERMGEVKDENGKPLNNDALALLAIKDLGITDAKERDALFTEWRLGAENVEEFKNKDAIRKAIDNGEFARIHGSAKAEEWKRKTATVSSKDIIEQAESAKGVEIVEAVTDAQKNAYDILGGMDKVMEQADASGSRSGEGLRKYVAKKDNWQSRSIRIAKTWGATAISGLVAGGIDAVFGTEINKQSLYGNAYNAAKSGSISNTEQMKNIDLDDPELSAFIMEAKENQSGITNAQLKERVAGIINASPDEQKAAIELATIGKVKETKAVYKALQNEEWEKAVNAAPGESDEIKRAMVRKIARAKGMDLDKAVMNAKIDKGSYDLMSDSKKKAYSLARTDQLIGGLNKWNTRDYQFGAADAGDMVGYESVNKSWDSSKGEEISERIKRAKDAFMKDSKNELEDVDETEKDRRFANTLKTSSAANEISYSIFLNKGGEKSLSAKAGAVLNNYGTPSIKTGLVKEYSSTMNKFMDKYRKQLDEEMGKFEIGNDPKHLREKMEGKTKSFLNEFVDDISNSTDPNDQKFRKAYHDNSFSARTEDLAKAVTQTYLGESTKQVPEDSKRKYRQFMTNLSTEMKGMFGKDVRVSEGQIGDALSAFSKLRGGTKESQAEALKSLQGSQAAQALIKHQFRGENGKSGDALWKEIESGKIGDQSLEKVSKMMDSLALGAGTSPDELKNMAKTIDMSDSGRATEALNKFNLVLEAILGGLSGQEYKMPEAPKPIGTVASPVPSSPGTAVNAQKEAPKMSTEEVRQQVTGRQMDNQFVIGVGSK